MRSSVTLTQEAFRKISVWSYVEPIKHLSKINIVQGWTQLTSISTNQAERTVAVHHCYNLDYELNKLRKWRRDSQHKYIGVYHRKDQPSYFRGGRHSSDRLSTRRVVQGKDHTKYQVRVSCS